MSFSFEAFVVNRNRINDREGEWVVFPTTQWKISDVMNRLGISEKENVHIVRYDTDVPGAQVIISNLRNHEDIDELNYLAVVVDNLDRYDFELFTNVLEIDSYYIDDMINLTENLECYQLLGGIDNCYDLGKYWIEDSGCYDLSSMGNLANYIDYEAFGRDVESDECGYFTTDGYTYGTDSETRYYDGVQDIPDEYIVFDVSDIEEFGCEEMDELLSLIS